MDWLLCLLPNLTYAAPPMDPCLRGEADRLLDALLGAPNVKNPGAFTAGDTPLHCSTTPRGVTALYLAHVDLNILSGYRHHRGFRTTFLSQLCRDTNSSSTSSSLTLPTERSLIRVLLALGADTVSDQPQNHHFCYSPLVTAVLGDDVEKVQILLEFGADVNEKVCQLDGDVRSPLMVAASVEYTNSWRIQELLMEYGAPVNDVIGSRGNTPFLCAVRRANVPAMERLRRFGADIHFADAEGNTPLMVACSVNETAVDTVLRMLVEAGGGTIAAEELMKRNVAGLTALDCARRSSRRLVRSTVEAAYAKYVPTAERRASCAVC